MNRQPMAYRVVRPSKVRLLLEGIAFALALFAVIVAMSVTT